MKNAIKKYYTVYKITNKINGKIYVGFHSTNDLDDGYLGSGKLIKRAIQKHGKDNFEKTILSIHDTKEAAEAEEKKIVDLEFTLREDTYNVSIGGNICILYGEANGFHGKTHTNETKQKISKKAQGRPTGNGNKIIHKDGRVFDTIAIAVKELGVKANSYNKLIYDCGDPDSDIRYVDEKAQLKAEEYFKEKNDQMAAHPEKLKAMGKKTGDRFRGKKRSQESIEKGRLKQIGKKKSAEHVDKINRNPEKIRKTAEKHRGMKRSEETRQRQSDSWKNGRQPMNKGKKHYHNPENPSENIQVKDISEVPEGWVRGTGNIVKNRGKWYNNGIEMKAFKSSDVIPEGWIRGRLPKDKKIVKWCNDGIVEAMLEIIPEGWALGRLKKSK